MKSLGVAPSQGGLLAYTLPAITDPNTQQTTTDSFAITQYLDKTYTDTPTLIPSGTAGLQRAFIDKVLSPLIFAAFSGLIYPVYEMGCFDEADRVHYRRTREAWFGGKSLEEIAKMGEEVTEEACKTFREGLTEIEKYAKAAGGSGVFIGGERPCFADTAVAGAFIFIIRTHGKEHALSKVILENEWASRLLVAFEQWA